MMFRQILLIIVFLASFFNAWGNSKADALRKSLYEAPDSSKAAILLNIAKLFQYEQADSFIYYTRLASEKAQRTHQDAALIDAETLLSQIALEKKDYGTATAHQRTILEAALRMRNWDLAMERYNAIAQTWLLRDNYAEAVEYLKKGLEIAKERNNRELLKYYYQALIDSYRKLRNMDAVCEYYPQLMAVNQQIDAEAYNNRINALQTERETLITSADDAKKWGQQRSTVSKVFNVIAIVWAVLVTGALAAAFIWFRYKVQPGITKTQKALDDTANDLFMLKKDQESAFRFLTQFIYTNINKLEEDIALFGAEQGVNLPVAMDSILNRINGEIYSLYGFFQNFTLLLQAQSGQLKPELVTVNIPQLATNLLTDYVPFSVADRIQLVNEVQNNTFAIADERLIDIVLRNMMSNALKYAPKGGRITVGTKVGSKVDTKEGTVEDPEQIEVWVTNDGIGLVPEQVEKLFELTDNLSLPGDPDTKGYGVGLAVCKAVIRTFKGRIWAETKPGEGFCIRFSLPRAKEIEVKTLSLAEHTQEIITTQDSPDNSPFL